MTHSRLFAIVSKAVVEKQMAEMSKKKSEK